MYATTLNPPLPPSEVFFRSLPELSPVTKDTHGVIETARKLHQMFVEDATKFQKLPQAFMPMCLRADGDRSEPLIPFVCMQVKVEQDGPTGKKTSTLVFFYPRKDKPRVD